ncbi:heparan-alpha-glucosaminide N-acetyltransferase [Paludicola sp. MB14-C6]|uniref:heparan-alpha-glucosaminide N-acetyltransferase n=1 Tax=Paludihabitans sp. MB14-C6 TaxID=3070656 RepID=UPI0027DD79AA|nr:heparan-alpha-glucosaminide N-acetyltransferase [Paludicola sp. MB14-C6]WMJ24267.1 heparan-alpha-glucosaminide N-acetyltransferase [Paludicola sp. MB14-C6]
MEQKKSFNRIHLIDEIRGFAIICMVVYHTFYDLVAIFGVNISFFFSPFMEKLVTSFVFLFVFISGTASNFSRSNLIRGLKCFGLGLIMTLFTFFFMKSQLIVFGILHMLGACMMLYSLLDFLLKKIHPVALIIGSILLYAFTYNVVNGYLGFENFLMIPLPHSLYQFGYLFPLGFVSPTFYSADYFALFPWLFCFIAGSGFGRLIQQNKLPKFIYLSHCKPIAFVGRHTLIVYILHQPIVYSILWIIFYFINQ